MKPKWIFEKDTFDEGNPEKMMEIVDGLGCDLVKVDYVPFGGMKRPGCFSDDDCVIAYGSINLIRALMKETLWIPTAWFNPGNLRCSCYYAHWGDMLFQREYIMLPWAELPRHKRRLYDTLSCEHCCMDEVFFRPDSNLKPFSGKKVSKEDFDHWYAQEQDCYSPDPESMVVAAAVQDIGREWRFVVCEGKVIAGSLYKDEGNSRCEPACPGTASWQKAQEAASHQWQPDDMYVVDVAETRGRPALEHLKVLEIGSFNCAGLYACPLEPCVQAATELAERQWRELKA